MMWWQYMNTLLRLHASLHAFTQIKYFIYLNYVFKTLIQVSIIIINLRSSFFA